MTKEALRRGDGHSAAFGRDGSGFDSIRLRCAAAVRLDVPELIGRQASRAERGANCQPKRGAGARPLRGTRFAAARSGEQLTADPRPAAFGMLAGFEHEDGRAFAIEHAVTVAVEGPADLPVIIERPREHGLAPGDERCRVEAAARTAGEHHVSPAAANDAGRLADGQQTRHVAQHDRIVGAAGIVGDRDVGGGHVGQMLEQPERMRFFLDRLRPHSEVEPSALESPSVGQFEVFDVGVDHVSAEDDAKPFRLDAAGGQACIAHREVGRSEAQLDVAAHDFQALARSDIDLGIEIGNLPSVGRS